MSTAPIWVAALSSVLAAIAGASANHRWTQRRDRTALTFQSRSAAADDIHEELINLHRLVRHSRTTMPHSRAISEAVASWQRVFQRHKSRVPKSMRHLRHSLWDALGTFFGGPGGSDITPEAMSLPVADYDYIWWEATLTYLEYLMAAVSSWRDNPSSADRIKCLNYNDWLLATDRGRR